MGGDDITLDNDLTDWKNVTERKALSDKVSSWKAVISADYSTLYISYEGTAQSEWDYGYTGQQNLVDITYATGLSDSNQSYSCLLRGMVEHRLRTAGMVI